MLRFAALVLFAALLCAAPAEARTRAERPHRLRRVGAPGHRLGLGPDDRLRAVDGRQPELTTRARTSAIQPGVVAGRTPARVRPRRSLGPERRHEIWMMNADGSRQRRLTRNASWDGSPTWSPDGRSILFVRGHAVRRPRGPAERRSLGDGGGRNAPAPDHADRGARARSGVGAARRPDRVPRRAAARARATRRGAPSAASASSGPPPRTGRAGSAAGSAETSSPPRPRGRPTARGSRRARASA